MSIPVPWRHMNAFLTFANRAGLRYAQCNPEWVTVYDDRSWNVAVAWLWGRGLDRQVVEC